MSSPNENENCDRLVVSSKVIKTSVVIWLLLLVFSFVMTLNVHAQPATGNGGKKLVRLGLLPHLSTPITIKKYKPLIAYLEQQLQQSIVVTTAPDYKTFIRRAEKGDFDLYLTAPNMAAYHEKHDKHVRIAKFTEKLQGVIVVAEGSPYQSLADLKGKTMATPDIMAVITSLGEVTLIENGIIPDQDIHIRYTESHNNSLQSVVKGQTDAAIVGYPAYKIITSDSKLLKPVRILMKTKVIPHLMFMSPPSVPFQEREKYKSSLLKFTANGAGKEFFSAAPFDNIGVITDEDMADLKGLLTILEQRLKK